MGRDGVLGGIGHAGTTLRFIAHNGVEIADGGVGIRKPAHAGLRPYWIIAILVAAVLLSVGAGYVLLYKGWIGSYAVIVLRSENGQRVELEIPIPAASASGFRLHTIARDSGLWFRELVDMFPIPLASVSSVVWANRSSPWLSLSTNGTLLVGIEWQPRTAEDVYPFASPSDRPPTLQTDLVESGSGVLLGLLSYSEWGNFDLTRAEARYALTTEGARGPEGNYARAHPGILLSQNLAVLPIHPSGEVGLHWGDFTISPLS